MTSMMKIQKNIENDENNNNITTQIKDVFDNLNNEAFSQVNKKENTSKLIYRDNISNENFYEKSKHETFNTTFVCSCRENKTDNSNGGPVLLKNVFSDNNNIDEIVFPDKVKGILNGKNLVFIKSNNVQNNNEESSKLIENINICCLTCLERKAVCYVISFCQHNNNNNETPLFPMCLNCISEHTKKCFMDCDKRIVYFNDKNNNFEFNDYMINGVYFGDYISTTLKDEIISSLTDIISESMQNLSKKIKKKSLLHRNKNEPYLEFMNNNKKSLKFEIEKVGYKTFIKCEPSNLKQMNFITQKLKTVLTNVIKNIKNTFNNIYNFCICHYYKEGEIGEIKSNNTSITNQTHNCCIDPNDIKKEICSINEKTSMFKFGDTKFEFESQDKTKEVSNIITTNEIPIDKRTTAWRSKNSKINDPIDKRTQRSKNSKIDKMENENKGKRRGRKVKRRGRGRPRFNKISKKVQKSSKNTTLVVNVRKRGRPRKLHDNDIIRDSQNQNNNHQDIQKEHLTNTKNQTDCLNLFNDKEKNRVHSLISDRIANSIEYDFYKL